SLTCRESRILSFVSTSKPPERRTAPLRVRCTMCTRPCTILTGSGIADPTYARHPSRGACGAPVRKWTGSRACDASRSVEGVRLHVLPVREGDVLQDMEGGS